MTRCVIAFGGNLGDSSAIFRRALERLSESGFRIRKVSSFLRTEPVDCPPGTPFFLNGAADGDWDGTPEALLDLCQKLEAEAGRPNDHPHHVSRTLDLDVILFGSRRIRTPRLTVPHPSAKDRDFVLIPLRELND